MAGEVTARPRLEHPVSFPVQVPAPKTRLAKPRQARFLPQARSTDSRQKKTSLARASRGRAVCVDQPSAACTECQEPDGQGILPTGRVAWVDKVKRCFPPALENAKRKAPSPLWLVSTGPGCFKTRSWLVKLFIHPQSRSGRVKLVRGLRCSSLPSQGPIEALGVAPQTHVTLASAVCVRQDGRHRLCAPDGPQAPFLGGEPGRSTCRPGGGWPLPGPTNHLESVHLH
jgi:hypothetical protein